MEAVNINKRQFKIMKREYGISGKSLRRLLKKAKREVNK